jgi:hypothetical protein
MRNVLPQCIVVALTAACSSSSPAQPADSSDSGSVLSAVGDAGAGDAGAVAPTEPALCSPAGPAPDGRNISVVPAQAAAIDPPQAAAWQPVSSSSDCVAIVPPAVPGRRTWTGHDATDVPPVCDPVIMNDRGDLAAFGLENVGFTTTFVPADGSAASMMISGQNDLPISLASHGSGFMFLQYTSLPRCGFVGPVTSAAVPTAAPQLVDTSNANVIHGTDQVSGLFANPLGGYVEAVTINQGTALQLRWVDNSLMPLGTWHTVLSWENNNNNWALLVDQTGKALVLSFLFPPSFGGTPPPSAWTFTAQWMDADGQVGAAFTPIAPVFTASSTTLFAGFGTVIALREGGFAMYRTPAPQSSGGTTSPTDWYAYYPSGQGFPAPVPDWLNAYDNSISLVGGGPAYAAVQQDPATCARTALLISGSGETCFTLAVENANGCAQANRITADGSLVVQDACHVEWWPGIARPNQ